MTMYMTNESNKELGVFNTESRSGLAVVVVLVLVGALAYLAPNIFIPIRTGEGGVLWRRFFGGTEMELAYGEGTVVIFPWDKVHVYDLSVQQLRLQTTVYTSDGLLLNVTVSARFRADREHLPRLHSELGPEYVDKLVEPELLASVRAVIGRFDAEQVYARGEQGLTDAIRSEFEARLAGQDIQFSEVLLVKLLMPERLQEAVQDKLAREQEALAAEFVLQREQQEKQRRIVEAEGLAAFESISGVSILHWQALEATSELARSPNAKIVVTGNDHRSLPVLLDADFAPPAPAPAEPAP